MTLAFLHHMPCRKIPYLVAIVQHIQNEKDVYKTQLILVTPNQCSVSMTSTSLTSLSRSHVTQTRHNDQQASSDE